ncbi:hypothetical protein BDV95DRAFT_591239 [Massariosphaeria phaeospora]|uniref:Secreted protein n=1 Tax=Massariosphaeria phaeospora TaxID=100035 RepID=A0A7C8ILT2_9PLEO|nr:hypothetical protein BDV95DRAFT_591239 [Massariosphaeria phaeospora]
MRYLTTCTAFAVLLTPYFLSYVHAEDDTYHITQSCQESPHKVEAWHFAMKMIESAARRHSDPTDTDTERLGRKIFKCGRSEPARWNAFGVHIKEALAWKPVPEIKDDFDDVDEFLTLKRAGVRYECDNDAKIPEDSWARDVPDSRLGRWRPRREPKVNSLEPEESSYARGIEDMTDVRQ